MDALIGVLAIGLMIMVTVIAAASLVIVATLPVARFLNRRRSHEPNG